MPAIPKMTKIDYLAERPTCVFDTECFANYWSVAFRCVKTARTRLFEFYEDHPLDRHGIAVILRNWRIVGFNSRNYDVPMLGMAMQEEASNHGLKSLSDEIIIGGLTPWRAEEKYDLGLPVFIDHIDLSEVNPGSPTRPSLKLCAGRMHSQTIQDLPFEHDEWITADHRETMRSYLGNDLDCTVDMWHELRPQVDLRNKLSARYGMDLRSKSDAQIAEAIIKKDVEGITSRRLYKPDVKPIVFNYKRPAWVQFETPELRELLATVEATDFRTDEAGIVQMPKFLTDKLVKIGDGSYKMGIGGLHSTEESTTHVADENHTLRDNDVASMYPNIILTTGLAPKHIGRPFTTVYRGIVEGRLRAKAQAKVMRGRIAELEAEIRALELDDEL